MASIKKKTKKNAVAFPSCLTSCRVSPPLHVPFQLTAAVPYKLLCICMLGISGKPLSREPTQSCCSVRRLSNRKGAWEKKTHTHPRTHTHTFVLWPNYFGHAAYKLCQVAPDIVPCDCVMIRGEARYLLLHQACCRLKVTSFFVPDRRCVP